VVLSGWVQLRSARPRYRAKEAAIVEADAATIEPGQAGAAEVHSSAGHAPERVVAEVQSS
jgi:hypothetical protein